MSRLVVSRVRMVHLQASSSLRLLVLPTFPLQKNQKLPDRYKYDGQTGNTWVPSSTSLSEVTFCCRSGGSTHEEELLLFLWALEVFCQSAIDGAQNDHASKVHAILSNKEVPRLFKPWCQRLKITERVRPRTRIALLLGRSIWERSGLCSPSSEQKQLGS